MPNGGDARKPENDKETRKVNWGGDAVVWGTEDFDSKIDQERRDEISGKAETV